VARPCTGQVGEKIVACIGVIWQLSGFESKGIYLKSTKRKRRGQTVYRPQFTEKKQFVNVTYKYGLRTDRNGGLSAEPMAREPLDGFYDDRKEIDFMIQKIESVMEASVRNSRLCCGGEVL
jgi:hypothetical protein